MSFNEWYAKWYLSDEPNPDELTLTEDRERLRSVWLASLQASITKLQNLKEESQNPYDKWVLEKAITKLKEEEAD